MVVSWWIVAFLPSGRCLYDHLAMGKGSLKSMHL